MEWLSSLLLVLDVICAIGVIVLVLLQHGKGADMGAAFGSGASGSLFGATGSANFLSRMTAGFAAGFFILTLALSFFGHKKPGAPKSIMEQSVPAGKPADTIPGQGAAVKPDAKALAAQPAAPKADAAKSDIPQVEPPKADATKAETPKADAPKSVAPKATGSDIPK